LLSACTALDKVFVFYIPDECMRNKTLDSPQEVWKKVKLLIGKNVLKEMHSQARWLYGISRGFKRSILALTCFSAVTGLIGVWSALLMKSFIDIAVGSQSGRLHETIILFILVLAVEIVLTSIQSIMAAKAKTRQSNDLKIKLFQKLMIAKWQPLSARHSGDYCSRMISDVDAVNEFLLTSVPDMISAFVQLVAATWVLLKMEPGLAIITLMVTPAFIVLVRLFARPMKEASHQMQSLKGDNLSLTQESIQNVTTIRAFEQQNEICNKLSNLQNNLLYWTIRRTKLNALSSSIQAASWSATYILSLLWGIVRLSQKAVSYGSLAAYLQLAAQIQMPFRQLAAQIPQLIATSASIGRLTEVLDMPEESLSHETLEFSGQLGVTFQDVCFAYQNDETVLDKLNMQIPPGTMIALVGPTGEGKSTVVRLLLGLVEMQSGSILLDQPGGSSIPVGACTRSAFTYVQQGNTTISGTIMDNLRMAKPRASLEEMEFALKQACAWDFVSALPLKMESSIGEHGIGLSEGQQQRLAIARALLRDAPILILDEATSALDKKTEEQLLKNIQSALHGRTCLVITHRSAALKLCSQVYRLSLGKAYPISARQNNGNIKYRIKRNRSYYRAAPAS
jgi:ABC-type bacteriocin/lantibiotic exporter with double-glycine peptidase domain